MERNNLHPGISLGWGGFRPIYCSSFCKSQAQGPALQKNVRPESVSDLLYSLILYSKFIHKLDQDFSDKQHDKFFTNIARYGKRCAVCPRSLAQCLKITYYTKWDKASWTDNWFAVRRRQPAKKLCQFPILTHKQYYQSK